MSGYAPQSYQDSRVIEGYLGHTVIAVTWKTSLGSLDQHDVGGSVQFQGIDRLSKKGAGQVNSTPECMIETNKGRTQSAAVEAARDIAAALEGRSCLPPQTFQRVQKSHRRD